MLMTSRVSQWVVLLGVSPFSAPARINEAHPSLKEDL